MLLLALLTIGGTSHAEPKAKPAPRRGTIYDSEPASITVRGQAKDREGRAIVGATVYLAMANNFGKFGYDAVLGQDVTDEQGHYEISTASLPVRLFPPNPEVVEGKFQVFGTAAGYGLTWHGTRAFRPRPRPAERGEPDMERAYYEGEPIINDVVFGPEAVIAGRVTDDLGRPLAEAKIQLGVIDDLRRPEAKMYRLELLPESDAAPRDADRVFDRVSSLPEFFLSTRTDADGRYRIGGLPRQAIFAAQATYRPNHDAENTTIATQSGPVQGVRAIGDDDEWNPVLAAPRIVFVQCLYADTGEPADHVTLCAQGSSFQMAGLGDVTDGNGEAMLELTPGEYQLAVEPALGAPYLRGVHRVKVLPMPLEQKAEILVERGAIVEIQAIDANAGQPATGVSFDYQTDTSAVRLELQTQTVLVDHPVTDAQGKLRAVVPPGKRIFALGKTTGGYQPSEHKRFVELTAGKTTFVRFQLQRAEGGASPPVAPAGDSREQRLYALARRQQSLVFRGTIRYRICRMSVAGSSRDDFRELIAAFGNTPPPDLMDRINERFPDWKIRFSEPYEMTIDGDRTRNVSRSAEDGKFAQPSTEVFNGRELVLYEPRQGQVAVGERQFLRRHTDGFRDFVRWPSIPAPFFAGVAADAFKNTSQADGKTTMEWQSSESASRLVADEQTGFAYEIASYRKTDGYGHDEWQFDPRQTAGGVILPRLRIVARSMDDSVNYIEIHAIESIEPSAELPADAFAVAVPPGTLFQVYDSEQPKHGMCTGPVSDAVSFAEAISPRNRSLFPFLERGKPVPRLAVETWLNQDGITKPPEFANKVVLVDFWSIGCGPCVAELPTVQAIVEKYAGTDLMVIGVHERGAAVGDLVEFAKKHGLTYMLGIDIASDEQGWFGESFKTYGVRGIPHAALIDRHGRLVLIDHLSAVIERIDGELAKP